MVGKLVADSATIAVDAKAGSKAASLTMEKFCELKLPYLKESSKIDSALGPMTEEQKAYFKNLNAERRKLKKNDTPTAS